MSKISELTDGGSLLPTDYLIAVRSGGNVKVQADDITVDQVNLGDNEFIRLGNSQDLTLVHNASNSIINQAGTGDLLIQKAGSTKLTVNSSGIDVTGTVVADGLTVDGDVLLNGDRDLHLVATNPNAGTSFQYGEITLGDAFTNQYANHAKIIANGNYASQSNLEFHTSNNNSSPLRMKIHEVGNISFYEDTGTTPKFLWSASDEKLTIDGNGGAVTSLATTVSESVLELNGNSTGGSDALYFGAIDSGGVNYIQVANGAGTTAYDLVLNPYGGNVVVGKTSTDVTIVGTELRANGLTWHTTDGIECLGLNRLTSDGKMLDFRKDSVTVGIIGTVGGRLTTGSGDTGLAFEDTNDRIIPHNTSTNAFRDAAIDLGYSSGRFKDLYLSGGVKLSGSSGIDDLSTSVSTSAVVITSAVDYGTLSIVAGNSAGNIFTDLVFWATTMGATVVTSGTVSGGPAARTYTVVGSALKLAMASGTYAVKTTNLKGSL